MIAVSLEFVVGYALLASAMVMWLNRRAKSAVTTGGVLLALCIVIAAVHQFAGGLAIPARQAIQLWLVFVLFPSAAVWGVSRAKVLTIHPSWLLFVGPMTFLVAIVFFATVFSILFPTRQLQ